ncbi:MAG TPA: NAD(P)/FAD-dependent oxidoreductase [Piscirickettsiaceae bacterium]|nr:NAD(P)/FAD-dependent oxidoreductase [Piscirickettsiaceae bacterium]
MKADVIIIGAGAAGLICAIEASKRGRKVLVFEAAEKAGKKILISGGGRCNFTNLHIDPATYLSKNPHFCKSALARYTQWDFIALMEKHNLDWHEKTLGQLFCNDKAPAVLKMLLKECKNVGIKLQAKVDSIQHKGQYMVSVDGQRYQSDALVIATGGPSIPKMGATDFGLQVARQFGIKTLSFRPALVPFTFHQNDIDRYFKDLSGLSVDALVSCNGQSFREGVLITHRGISGPAILQISSYWYKGDEISVDLLPDLDASDWLLQMQDDRGKTELKTILSKLFPKRLAVRLADTLTDQSLSNLSLGQIKQSDLKAFGATLNNWVLRPSGTEGMRTAEVCTGGVNTDELSSKTMEVKSQAGLYFIGETVDVTGWLGGYNFQWAWSSGWAAGQVV